MEFVRSDKPSSLGAIFDKEAEAGRTAAAAAVPSGYRAATV
jgi:hypothetical protein